MLRGYVRNLHERCHGLLCHNALCRINNQRMRGQKSFRGRPGWCPSARRPDVLRRQQKRDALHCGPAHWRGCGCRNRPARRARQWQKDPPENAAAGCERPAQGGRAGGGPHPGSVRARMAGASGVPFRKRGLHLAAPAGGQHRLDGTACAAQSSDGGRRRGRARDAVHPRYRRSRRMSVRTGAARRAFGQHRSSTAFWQSAIPKWRPDSIRGIHNASCAHSK